MFTGIVEALGRVVTARVSGERGELVIDLGHVAEGVRVGDSVCVSGACLTATRLDGSTAAFDVSAETLARTTLGGLKPGDSVNLERALRVGDRLGGHFVQGHVDAVGEIVRKDEAPGQWTVEVAVPTDLAAGFIPKGSVAVDGVSLTIAELRPGRFAVALIPHTVEATTLKRAQAGDRVNIEGDMIGKYVARLLGASAGEKETRLTREFLAEHGFGS